MGLATSLSGVAATLWVLLLLVGWEATACWEGNELLDPLY